MLLRQPGIELISGSKLLFAPFAITFFETCESAYFPLVRSKQNNLSVLRGNVEISISKRRKCAQTWSRHDLRARPVL